MIQVGDKFKDELKEWTVCEVYRGAALAFSGNITREFSKQYIYTIMYLEQKQRVDELEEKIDKNKRLHDAAIKSAGILFSDEKQRADRAEKRWSELKNKVEAISISLGTTGRMDSYIMYIHILDTMQQLLEDDDA